MNFILHPLSTVRLDKNLHGHYYTRDMNNTAASCNLLRRRIRRPARKGSGLG